MEKKKERLEIETGRKEKKHGDHHHHHDDVIEVGTVYPKLMTSKNKKVLMWSTIFIVYYMNRNLALYW